MIATTDRSGIQLQARDVSRQRLVTANGIPRDATVGELVQGLVSRMGLPNEDVEGRQLSYQARLDREGRHLHSSETVGDVLQENDELVLHPRIQAGAL